MRRRQLSPPARSKVNPPDQPDQHGRGPGQCQMQKQNALQFLPLQLKLPRQYAGCDCGQRRNSCPEQVVVRGVRQALSLSPPRDEIKRHAGDEQSNWKMDEHHMLCVFGQQYCFQVEWMGTHLALTRPSLSRSSSGGSNKNTEMFLA